MIIRFRPHRGLLADSMREAVLFRDEEEMFKYICDVWNNSERRIMFRPEDLSIGENLGKDSRINWTETRYVCTKRMGDTVFDTPQCIGMCSFEDAEFMEKNRVTVEKLEVLKVGLENEYYVLVVPNEGPCVGEFRDLFLANDLHEHVMWLLSLSGLSDEDILEIIEKNAAEYIKWYREENGV